MSRAIEYRRFGEPEVLEEVERPAQAPGDGEIRIAVRAVGLNPLDFKTFEGDLRRLERVQRLIHPRRWFEGTSARFPRGVARDFAGVIDAVGAGVTDLAVGDAVLGTLRSAPGQADTRGALTIQAAEPAQRRRGCHQCRSGRRRISCNAACFEPRSHRHRHRQYPQHGLPPILGSHSSHVRREPDKPSSRCGSVARHQAL